MAPRGWNDHQYMGNLTVEPHTIKHSAAEEQDAELEYYVKIMNMAAWTERSGAEE
jgi:hypothetical protein